MWILPLCSDFIDIGANVTSSLEREQVSYNNNLYVCMHVLKEIHIFFWHVTFAPTFVQYILKVTALPQFAESAAALLGDTLSNPIFETWEITEFKVSV